MKKRKSYKTEAEPKAVAGGVPVFCAHDAIVPVGELRPNPKNPNKHPQSQIEALGVIIRSTGWRQPITVSNLSGYIVKGHGRLEAALLEGFTEVPVDYQDYANESEEYADLVADNRIAELAELDNRMLAEIFAEIDTSEIPVELTGYSEAEVDELTQALADALAADDEDEDMDDDEDGDASGAAAAGEDDEPDPADEVPEPPPPGRVVTKRGDLWILGHHRVLCGDATNAGDMAALLDGAQPEILLTDPPYCSGGFQESGRVAGSIGTKQADGAGGFTTPTISSDNLSTRGYQVLMKSVLGSLGVKVAYIFTDWRMWVYLFDIVEASGLGVRSMIVWNKKSPGMGNGWRAQHELVMFAHRTKPKWDNHKGYGNVLEASRSGNEYHPTQKPVEILEKLLDNTSWAQGVLDAFGGSGSTMIAAEAVGQSSYTMEIEPALVDVIVKRYVRTTGRTSDVELIRKGKAVDRDQYEDLLDD